jgi:hypothetical protein
MWLLDRKFSAGSSVRNRRFWAAACVTSLMLASAGVAAADTMNVDGDTADAPSGNILHETCAAQPVLVPGQIVLKYAGNSGHYLASEPLTISATVTAVGGSTNNITSSASSSPHFVASPWNANGQTTTIDISTSIPANTPDDTYHVSYSVTGDTSHYPLSNPVSFNVICGTDGGGAGGNNAPTVNAGGPYSGNEGSAISLDGTVTDEGTPALTWSAAPVGNVNGAICTFSSTTIADPTITCNDNGTWTLTLTADDGFNAAVSGTATLTVGNVAPAVGLPTVTPTGACSASVSAGFSDAGTNDTHTGQISWGDSTNAAATVNESGGAGTASGGSHTYTSAGTKTITVTVTDDDFGIGSASSAFTTLNTPSNFLAPINTGAGPRSVFKLGSTIPVKITVRDCSGNPVSTLTPLVQLVKIDSAPDGSVNESQVGEVPTNGKNMRWDGTQYIYNLSTKNSQFSAGGALTQGSYRLSVTEGSFFGSPLADFDLK